VAFKQFPLPNHKEARNAARLSILAQEHGKFWEVHDAIFENMRTLGTDTYVKIGTEHGIPEAEVRRVLEEKAYEKRINAEYAEGNRYRVNSTPTSFVNGNRVKGAKPYEGFKEEVDKALEKKGLTPPAAKTGALPAEKEPPADPGTVKAAARPGGGHVSVGKAPVEGTADAPVTIVTFGDYR
jgi:protein-disulfide isomerase